MTNDSNSAFKLTTALEQIRDDKEVLKTLAQEDTMHKGVRCSTTKIHALPIIPMLVELPCWRLLQTQAPHFPLPMYA